MRKPLYQDSVCSVHLAEQPLVGGHLLIIPTKTCWLEDLTHDESAHIHTVASYCATLLFEGLKAQGTNIIVSNGPDAKLTDEVTDKVAIHVLPRSQEDNLGLLWKPVQGDPDKLKDTASSIKEHMRFGELPKPEKITLSSAPQADGSVETDLRIQDIMKKYH